jgi:hypothetical protein
MKQIDKLAWIEIKDKKNTFHRSFEKTNTIFWWKREVNETDLEALTREIKRRIKRRS